MQIALVLVVLSIGAFAAYMLRELWHEHRKFESHVSSMTGEGANQIAGKRYKEIFDNGSDAVFVMAVRRYKRLFFESLNPLAVQVLSAQARDLSGCSFNEVIDQVKDSSLFVFIGELNGYLRRCIASGLMIEYESVLKQEAAGDGKTYHIKLIPLPENGEITHVICFAQDISAHKLYKQELLDRSMLEQRLSRFTASAPGFFYTYRHNVHGGSSMPFASDGIRDLFGLQPEDVAQSIVPMNMRVHPDDMQILIEGFAKSARNLSLFNAEFRVHHPDKGELWVELNSMPLAEPDDSILWHGFMYNISERKQIEGELLRSRKNLEEAQRIGQMGGWELNIATGKLIWSDEIYRIFEIDPENFGASYDAFLHAIHPDDRNMVNKAYMDSVENRTPYCMDHRLLFAEGRIKYVRECCETHYDENGNPLHSHGTVQDVTVLKEAERQLGEMQKKLRELAIVRDFEAEKSRKRIAWEMHEDLAQILVAAKMRMSGMRTKLPRGTPSLGEDSSAVVSLIDKSIESVRELVSDLLPTVLMYGITPAMEWLSAEFKKRHAINCVLNIADGCEVADEELITLAFRIAQDVLNDIARFNGVEKVIVAWKKQQGSYWLTVSHDGESAHREQSLNLFSAQERLSAYGGEMSVFSTPEQGSGIKARLPCKEEQYRWSLQELLHSQKALAASLS